MDSKALICGYVGSCWDEVTCRFQFLERMDNSNKHVNMSMFRGFFQVLLRISRMKVDVACQPGTQCPALAARQACTQRGTKRFFFHV